MRNALLISLFAFLVAPSSRAACKVEDPVFANYYRVNDQEGNFNDYGRIHYDADHSPECAQKAAWALTDKLKSTVDYVPPPAGRREFQDWLRGAHMALIFAAAERIGANGFATKELDTQLKRAADDYRFNLEQDSDGNVVCNNINGNNSCIDDYAVAASGLAWIAAYKYRRNPSDSAVMTFQDQARAQIDNFFRNACRLSNNPTVLCKDYDLEPPADTDQTWSFNHGQQMQPYGFGLMTSIASAVRGLEASGSAYSFTPSQKIVARLLMKEMQAHVDTAPSPDTFTSTCTQVTRGSNLVYTFDMGGHYCGGGGTDPYEPQMYALYQFYAQKIGNVPTAPYMSNSFYSGHFKTSSTAMDFFSFSRRETYGQHGYNWWSTASGPEWMPFDNYNPKQGFLEQIGPTGLAQGWTCDWDAPTKSIPVDLYFGSTKITNATVPFRADSESEAPINTECHGGSFHRFWYQLPTWTKGQTITAHGLDYTWFGTTQLPCLQPGGCKW